MDSKTVIEYTSGGRSFRMAWPPNGHIWFGKIDGIDTEVEMSDSQSYGQVGTTVSGQIVRPKKITVNGAVWGSSGAEVQSYRDSILSIAAPTRQGRLLFCLGDGTGWYIDGYPTDTAVFSDGETVQKFQFQFYAPYPFFRSSENVSYQLSGLQALWQTPFFTGGTFWISKYTQDAFSRVENAGNVAQSISLRLYASAEVTNPIIYNVDRGTHISVKKVLKTGESFLISTFGSDKDAGRAAISVSAGGEESNGFRYITPDSDLSMTVSPGGNIFMASAEANRQNLRCTLTTAGGERHGI